MEEKKILTLVSSVRRGQQAALFQAYAKEVFAEIRQSVMDRLEYTDEDYFELKGILRAIREIENTIQQDINSSKMAERKIQKSKNSD